MRSDHGEVMSEEKKTLSAFLRSVEDRIKKQTLPGVTSFRVKVTDRVIELRFTGPGNAETAARFMTGIVTDEKDATEPDAVFYYWCEDLSPYVPEIGGGAGVWRMRDETGFVRVTPNYSMIAADYTSRTCFFCRQPSGAKEYMLYGHAMIVSFGIWAELSDMILLHSACVGAGGRGVMLSARGGGGKSTLAVSCLLDGFDFVADDYILVNRTGEPKAMPLYRTVGLNTDMAAILKPPMPVVSTDPERNGKLLLDASAFDFSRELPVRAIIHPVVSPTDSPMIRPAPAGPVLAGIIESTATQTGVFRDPGPYRRMAQRLMGIPVYEILLSRDLDLNRKYLKNFIVKEL